jgi:putative N-acetylmannosamine-6-phosphate epimerase
MWLVNDPVERMAGGLVVSCQADADSPLNTPVIMAAMARAAELGGAVAIRADTPDNVSAIKASTNLPVIGLQKIWKNGRVAYITAGFQDAARLATAGADIIALEATNRPRPSDETLEDLIQRVHTELNLPVMADIDSVDAGLKAASAGADLLATTLSGYTDDGPVPDGPNIGLVRALVAAQRVPVVAEGRVWTREDAGALINAGAYAVVVGTAITNPTLITRRLARAVFEANRPKPTS